MLPQFIGIENKEVRVDPLAVKLFDLGFLWVLWIIISLKTWG